MARLASRRGRVKAFDEQRGTGVLHDSDLGRDLEFHCTAMVDGTRTIEVGANVSFQLIPSHAGRVEAGRIEKL